MSQDIEEDNINSITIKRIVKMDTPNSNRVIYTKEVYENAIKDYIDNKVNKGLAFASIGPQSVDIFDKKRFDRSKINSLITSMTDDEAVLKPFLVTDYNKLINFISYNECVLAMNYTASVHFDGVNTIVGNDMKIIHCSVIPKTKYAFRDEEKINNG